MRRRSLLVALGTGIAGCNSRPTGEREETTPTVTPLDVPVDENMAEAPLPPGESRFDAETPAPEGVKLFHNSSPDEKLVVVPSREVFTMETGEAPIWLRNHRPDQLYVSSGWGLEKFTGHRWVRILAPHLNRGGLAMVPAGSEWRRQHRIENVFSLPVLGPGLYARIERARVNDGTVGGVRNPLGMLFEVQGTTYTVEPSRSARREGDVATMDVSSASNETMIVERVGADPDIAEPLVPEVIGAIPIFRDSIPLLSEVSEVRIESPSASLTFDYLAEAPVRDVAVGPETLFEHDGIVFTVRVE